MINRLNGLPRQALRAALVLVVLAAAGVGLDMLLTDPSTAQQSQPPPPPRPAVPVKVAPTVRQDVPLYLRGLGAVQAFNSVLVRARVDGTLTQVPVTEGQDVKQGALLAVIDPRPFQASLDAARAKQTQDEADLNNAKQDLARYATLAQKNFASHQQVDTQQSMVNRLTAAIAGDTAAVQTAQLNLSFCFITSPVDGRVGLRQVDPGNLVHASDTNGIMTVTQVQPISVTFTLPQDQLPRVNAAMAERKLAVLAYAADDKTELDRGTLLTPDNSIDPATGTIKLKAVFPNPKNALWPGQFVNARLLLDTDKNVLTVPSAAVQHGPSGLYVYVVKPDLAVARQVVEVQRDNGVIAVIAKGLEEGDQVVTDGQSRLQVGTRVALTDTSKQAAAPAKSGS